MKKPVDNLVLSVNLMEEKLVSHANLGRYSWKRVSKPKGLLSKMYKNWKLSKKVGKLEKDDRILVYNSDESE